MSINNLLDLSRLVLKEHENEIKLFLITSIIYSLSLGNWITSNDLNCIYLAHAFLNGRLDIAELPLIPVDLAFYNGKWYSPFPPLPSLLVAPIVYLVGRSYYVRYLTTFFGSVNVVLVWSLLKKIGIGKEEQRWLTLLFSFGSIHWFYSTTLFNHTYSVFFLLVSMNEALSRNRPALVGFLIGCAGLCRYPTFLSIPFFLLYLRRDRVRRNVTLLILGLMLPLSFLFYYNYVRFGNPLETGYQYQIMLMGQPKPYGIFDLRYMSANLYRLFLKPMVLTRKFPYIVPDLKGLALTFTTPASAFALKMRARDPKTIGLWSGTLLIFTLLMCFAGTGGDQFGYRYGLDFFPFLFLLSSQGINKSLNALVKLLIIVGVIVNFWGILFFNGINLHILSYFID